MHLKKITIIFGQKCRLFGLKLLFHHQWKTLRVFSGFHSRVRAGSGLTMKVGFGLSKIAGCRVLAGSITTRHWESYRIEKQQSPKSIFIWRSGILWSADLMRGTHMTSLFLANDPRKCQWIVLKYRIKKLMKMESTKQFCFIQQTI